jgi:hypothetical protein
VADVIWTSGAAIANFDSLTLFEPACGVPTLVRVIPSLRKAHGHGSVALRPGRAAGGIVLKQAQVQGPLDGLRA